MSQGSSGSAVPPHSVEAEEYLISAVLLDETGQAWAIAQHVGIKPAAFYVPSAGLLWEAIAAVRKETGSCDLPALAVHLETTKQLAEIGGYAYLSQVTNRAFTTAQVRPMAETLKLLWEMRHGLKSAGQFIEDLRNLPAGESLRDSFLKLASELGQRLIRLGHRTASKSLAQHYDDVAAEAEARVMGTVDKARWIFTGLPRFDDEAKPMGSRRADGFVLLPAGSGDGKTTAMCMIGAFNLEMSKSVLMYSREVDTPGFIEKMVSAKLAVDLNNLETLPKPDLEKFKAECGRQSSLWADKKLWCVQQEPSTPIFTVEDVVDHARAHVQLRGVPDLMMVDYLQIFDTRKKMGGANREAVVAHVSHTLQALQRELGCVMIVGCQLNEKGLAEMREVKKGEDGQPKFRLPHRGDLRESQAAYHDADRVIFLFRPPVDSTGNDQHRPGMTMREMWWYQEKRRAGGICVSKTMFEMRYCRFSELGNKLPVTKPAGLPSQPQGPKMSKADWLKVK